LFRWNAGKAIFDRTTAVVRPVAQYPATAHRLPASPMPTGKKAIYRHWITQRTADLQAEQRGQRQILQGGVTCVI
jgi:hypothetical protein